MGRSPARRTIENTYRRLGFVHVAGVDEVGRGCLAGPVVTAAVVLDPGRHIGGLADSKIVPAPERDRLYDVIVRRALAWAVAAAEPDEIDTFNIHQASLQIDAAVGHGACPAARPGARGRVPDPGPLHSPARIAQGDRRCAAIAAASIVAKVTRDRLMCDLHTKDPRYGFDRHKGYATAEHLAAVARFGYSSAHRRTFRPPSLFDTMEVV